MAFDARTRKSLARVENQGSYGEKQLVRALARFRLNFEYERPVAVRDRGYVRLWYPDFWLPDLDVYLEYAGGPDSAARALAQTAPERPRRSRPRAGGAG